MNVAVITPYSKEDIEVLKQCHKSVARQTHKCTHIMIADGFPLQQVIDWPVQHISLPSTHADNGNTPRSIGSLSAINQGFDAIAYLDADNWFYEHHIEAMIGLHQTTQAVVCTATRSIHRLDGSFMYIDTNGSNGSKFADTSCLFLTRNSFRLAPYWAMMPKDLAPVCDRIIWSSICARNMSLAHHADPTVAFRTKYQGHYRRMGETPPPGTKSSTETVGRAEKWWSALPDKNAENWRRYFDTGEW